MTKLFHFENYLFQKLFLKWFWYGEMKFCHNAKRHFLYSLKLFCFESKLGQDYEGVKVQVCKVLTSNDSFTIQKALKHADDRYTWMRSKSKGWRWKFAQTTGIFLEILAIEDSFSLNCTCSCQFENGTLRPDAAALQRLGSMLQDGHNPARYRLIGHFTVSSLNRKCFLWNLAESFTVFRCICHSPALGPSHRAPLKDSLWSRCCMH